MNERHVGGLWCREVLEHLDVFVDGGLDAVTLNAVKAHVSECSQCASFGAAYARLISALRVGADHALDEARFQRLMRRLEEVP